MQKTFPKAAKVNKISQRYETKPAKDKVLVLTGIEIARSGKNNKTVRLFNQVLGGFNRTGTLLKTMWL